MAFRDVVVLSPHCDDVALSIGDYLTTALASLTVLTLFDVSKAAIIDVTPTEVPGIRRLEERAFAGKFGIDALSFAGLPDSSVRGVPWNTGTPIIDHGILSTLKAFLSERLAYTPPDDLFVPAAFGLHPDHLMTLLAIATPLGARLSYLEATRIWIYFDEPYYSSGGPTTPAHERLTTRARPKAYPVDLARKRKMLSLYPSQVSRERVAALTRVGQSEHYMMMPDAFLKAVAVQCLHI